MYLSEASFDTSYSFYHLNNFQLHPLHKLQHHNIVCLRNVCLCLMEIAKKPKPQNKAFEIFANYNQFIFIHTH